MNELQPLLDLLGGKGAWIGTVIVWMGALRLVAKFFSGWLQGVFTKGLQGVVDSIETDDDALAARILASLWYRALAFVIDLLTSIKLPSSQSLRDLQAAKDKTKGTNATDAGGGMFGRLLLIVALGLGALTLTGCVNGDKPFGFIEVQAGADPMVVHAEWLAENGANAVDQFLLWERNNEATLLAENPAIHATADAVRDSAPDQLLELRRATRQYKADKSDVNKGKVQAATNAVLAIVNAVRAQQKLPPIQTAIAPTLFKIGDTNGIR